MNAHKTHCEGKNNKIWSQNFCLVKGRMMTETRRSRNSNARRKIMLLDEFEVILGYPCRNMQKAIGNIGLYAEKTASVSSFNTEN